MFDDDRFITTNRLISGYQLAKFHTFEAVARYNSFMRAAEELCITPSAVSHQINKLEEELNFKLFNRFHRRIELTPDGENLFNILKKSVLPLQKNGLYRKYLNLIKNILILP
jgi:Transcriptional regulator